MRLSRQYWAGPGVGVEVMDEHGAGLRGYHMSRDVHVGPESVAQEAVCMQGALG